MTILRVDLQLALSARKLFLEERFEPENVNELERKFVKIRIFSSEVSADQ